MENNLLDSSGGHSVEHRFSFTASGADYAPIWLSNLALTILTLGLYSPWAKVRREKFFHNHTLLAGSSFDYTAEPWKILKGRMLIFALVILWSFSEYFSVWATVALFLTLLALTPLIIRLAMRFKTRYTTYRNMHFAFHGTYADAVKVFLLWPLSVLPTLLLSWPFVKRLHRKYFIDHISYGGLRAQANPSVRSFYGAYLKIILICLLVASSMIVLALAQNIMSSPSHETESQSSNLAASETLKDGSTVELSKAERDERISEAVSKLSESLLRFFLVIISLILAFSLLTILPKVLRALLAKATWNHSTLGNARFRYSISITRYTWIEFSNLLLKFLTLWLASPYCAVRIYRYKVENLVLEGPLSIDELTSQAERELNALGDQAAEIYDVNIDFGL